MSKQIESLCLAAQASADKRTREELSNMSGKDLAQALYYATIGKEVTNPGMTNNIISECMHRLERDDGSP